MRRLALVALLLTSACGSSMPHGAQRADADGVAAAPLREERSVAETAAPLPAPRRGVGDAVSAGLDHLARTQNPDGGWGEPGDVGTTGLALLAFLGAGETHNVGSHATTIRSGLRHLVGRQTESGALASPDDPDRVRRDALAALALTEAYGMTGSKLLRDPARRAARHGATLSSSDPLTAALLASEQTSARMSDLAAAALPVPESAGVGADELTALAVTAMRFWLREEGTPADAAVIERHVASLGTRDVAALDPYAVWLGGVLALQQGEEMCGRWRAVVYPALVETQIAGGAEDGGWPPRPVPGSSRPDVATTALRLLVLDTAFRHAWRGPWAR